MHILKQQSKTETGGPGGGREGNLERSYYQTNSCHCWARLERILRYSRVKKGKVDQEMSVEVSIQPNKRRGIYLKKIQIKLV